MLCEQRYKRKVAMSFCELHTIVMLKRVLCSAYDTVCLSSVLSRRLCKTYYQQLKILDSKSAH